MENSMIANKRDCEAVALCRESSGTPGDGEGEGRAQGCSGIGPGAMVFALENAEFFFFFPLAFYRNWSTAVKVHPEQNGRSFAGAQSRASPPGLPSQVPALVRILRFVLEPGRG